MAFEPKKNRNRLAVVIEPDEQDEEAPEDQVDFVRLRRKKITPISTNPRFTNIRNVAKKSTKKFWIYVEI